MAQIPHAEAGLICPLHKEDMSKVCHTCPLWIMIRGLDKNTGKEVDEWGCTLRWLPAMMIENARMQQETGAAVESFRNEVTNVGKAFVQNLGMQLTMETDPRKLING